MIYIHDPKLLSKENPDGRRHVTQDDVDALQRVSVAYAHLVSQLAAWLPMALADAANIVAGNPLMSDPAMSDDDLALYMELEDEIAGFTKTSGITFLDADGNLVCDDAQQACDAKGRITRVVEG